MPEIVATYEPRWYQVPSFQALVSGKANRIVTVWHRRAGKDVSAFNALWIIASQHKGNYGYFFPYATQGRRAIWYGITNDGTAFRDFIPQELIHHEHDTDMRITLVNGSTIQFIGTDNIDAKMGSNFAGVVMSEYPLQDPSAWNYIEPILKINGGWAWFPFTPRGKENHGYTLYKAAERLQEKGEPWFAETLTINDTGLLVDSDLDDLRERGVQEEFIQQEYYCNFGVSNFGAYFAHQIADLKHDGRINRQLAWIPDQLVHTAWDFGVSDSTAIWFIQKGPYDQWYAIDYLEDKNQGLNYYIKLLNSKPYAYGTHLVPHDAEQRDFITGMSKVDAAFSLGVTFEVVPKLPKTDQIDATHRMIPLMHFNEIDTYQGVAALSNYERKWNDKLKAFESKPLHNWASHPADAFMTFVCGNRLIRDNEDELTLSTASVGDFDPRGS